MHDYLLEFCKTRELGNADALSCLAADSDPGFDGEEMDEDVAMFVQCV